MMVRARERSHLVALRNRFASLKGLRIRESPNHDYRWRMLVPQYSCATIVSELVLETNWSNFKGEVARFQGMTDYERSLHDVWGVMHRLQLNAHRAPKQPGGPATPYDPYLDPNLKCELCGCTNDQACPGGCHWVTPGVCSACVPDTTPASLFD